MKILSVLSTIRDEEFYIEMAVRSVLDRSYGVYILDTGSTDSTLNVIKGLNSNKIVVEQKNFGGKFRFDMGVWEDDSKPPSGYDEAKARTYAFKRAAEVFPEHDWVLATDADEIVTDAMFDEVERAGARQAFQLGHASLCPLTPYTYLNSEKDRRIIWDTLGVRDIPYSLFDPHTTAWKKNFPVQWTYGKGGFHICPVIPNAGRMVTTKDVKIHLHYGFGPKAIHGWLCEWTTTVWQFARKHGISLADAEKQGPYMEKFPDWFINGKFTPKHDLLKSVIERSLPLEIQLPKYVVDKWNEWGDYELKE